MKTLKLVEEDFKKTKDYYKVYCGKVDVSNFDGNIIIEESTSYLLFHKLSAKGYILRTSCPYGIISETDIETEGFLRIRGDIVARGNIIAEGNIRSKSEIIAGGDIKAGGFIKSVLGLSSNKNIQASGPIVVWFDIKAKKNIKTNEYIQTNGKIEAGEEIITRQFSYSQKIFEAQKNRHI